MLVDEDDDLETWGADEALEVVGKPTPRIDGAARATGRARFTVDVVLPGMLHAAVLRSPVAHGRVRALDLDAARARPGVRAVLGPESALVCTTKEPLLAAEPAVRGSAHRGRRSRHAGAARDAARARSALDVEPLAHVVVRRRGAARPALHEGAGGGRARRRRCGPRCRRRDGRGRGGDAGAPADAARAARGRRLVGRGRAHGLGLDAGNVRGARRAREGVRPARRPGASDHRVRRRRLRRQAGRGLRGADGRGAGSRDRAAGAPRQRSPRRAARRRPARGYAADRAARREPGRHHRRRRRRRRRVDGAGRLGVPRLHAGEDDVSLRRRAHDDVPGEGQPAGAERLPCARGDRGHHGARAGGRRARARARSRPARAAAAQPRHGRPGERPALLGQRAPGLLRPRRGARGLGAARRAAGAPARRPSAWHGLCDADLVGRRRPACARHRAARRRRPGTSRHRHPGHRHGHAHGGRGRRGRGARPAGRRRQRRGRRHRTQRVRARRGRLDDDAVRAAGRPLGRGQGAQDAAPAGVGHARDLCRRPRRSAPGASAPTTARSTCR